MATLWRQADQFDWFGAYLLDRGLQTQWRIATFVFTICLAAVPLVMLGSPVGPDTPLAAARRKVMLRLFARHAALRWHAARDPGVTLSAWG